MHDDPLLFTFSVVGGWVTGDVVSIKQNTIPILRPIVIDNLEWSLDQGYTQCSHWEVEQTEEEEHDQGIAVQRPVDLELGMLIETIRYVNWVIEMHSWVKKGKFL